MPKLYGFSIFSAYFPEKTVYLKQADFQERSDSGLNAPVPWRIGSRWKSGLLDKKCGRFSDKCQYQARESVEYRLQPFLFWQKFLHHKLHRRNRCKSSTQVITLPEYSSPDRLLRNRLCAPNKPEQIFRKERLRLYLKNHAIRVLKLPFPEQSFSTFF